MQSMKAQQKLVKLQDKDATEEEIDDAIQQVANLKAAEMKIMVKNRMKMEQIIGKEKFAEFMDVAREKYRKHKGQQGQKNSERSQRKEKPQQKETSPTE